MNQNKIDTLLAGLDRIEDMLNDMDVASSKKAFGAPDEATGDADTSNVDTELSADAVPELDADDKPGMGNLEAAEDESPDGDLESELQGMADAGDPGSKGALSIFKKEKPEDDDEDEDKSWQDD